MRRLGLLQGMRRRSRPGDAHLAATVKVRLTSHPELMLEDVTVGAKSGVVLLEGSIANTSQRALAAGVAASVPGVRGVFNRLMVADGHDHQA